jgi:hypothetical protein
MAERQGRIDTGCGFVARDWRGYRLVDHLWMSRPPRSIALLYSRKTLSRCSRIRWPSAKAKAKDSKACRDLRDSGFPLI